MGLRNAACNVQTFHELRIRYDQQQDGQAGRAIPAAAGQNNGGGAGAGPASQFRAMAGSVAEANMMR